MKTKLMLIGSLVAAALLTSQAHADDKFTLGRTILLEHGSAAAKIPMVICRRTNAIQIRAEKDLTLRKAVVKFQNGESKTFSFYRDFKEDDKSDWRYFGYRRCVKSIDVYGNSEGSKAGVRVYGKEKK
ncbi:DUF2541 family protein [Vibrio renipiscarius]|uniref:DUF2541 domain-containing protein n=1 Tax=Vibrio renipiscarius TaxID=1461322 RepID=A0A0C2K155_9VIBR|nr:DUF2541 family protein [Vibrio renipiscarius]KII75633.1 hypothetical protein PL18_18110 [Vibrio renipiscarius]KII81917.1 hypothetical protein OJ16_01625 [Vibrio renipiscarius]